MAGLVRPLGGFSDQDRICLVWGEICSVKQDELQQKSRSGVKMMNLGPDKLTTNKQDTIEQVDMKWNN
jgi:hypothetical protein